MSTVEASIPASELDKFRALIFLVHSQGKPVTVASPDSSTARALRRRFYRLRDSLPTYEREIGDSITYSLQGRLIILSLKLDWSQQVQIGEPNVPADQSLDSEGDRLDDDGRPRDLRA